MRQEGTSSGLLTMASALTPPGRVPGGFQAPQQDPAGVHWAPAEIRHLLTIMEEPTIKRRLKMVRRNTSVYEDVARRLHEHGYVRHPHQCRTKFKALKVAYKKAHMAVLHSGAAPQGCPFYEEMGRVLQTKGSTSPDNFREQTQPGDLDHHNWPTERREDGPEGHSLQQLQQEEPEPGMDMETEHQFKLEVEVLELPSDLSPESLTGTQAERTTEISPATQGTGAEVQRRPGSPDRNQPQKDTRSPAPKVLGVSPVPPRARVGRVRRLQPRARNLRRHQPATAMIASEMAENRRLASELARESAAQLQRYLDQHNAHMAALVQVARDSYTQRQEVVAILQDVADDIHEGVALLRSSVGRLSQE
ncbi:myb/SANT-like DNA-binding domain-containing protein 7 [Loxodonta africana]|uniref:myb/SANT-like DNA-binding domain-containing protein 7 n=1 Tax=Loxodonta africana TaxID=9785 RepID=UPI000C811B8E|nr:uncharacterized protein LOC111749831 [Loxodonta africana]